MWADACTCRAKPQQGYSAHWRSKVLPAVCLVAAVIILGAGASQAISYETLISPTGEAAEDQFGESVSNAGDVNGDGYDDLIVGAGHNDAGGDNAGRAYVFYGGPGISDVADLTLTGEAAGDFFGVSVAGAGDFNGDGYADLIVGADGNDAYGMDAGRAYLFYGGPNPDDVPDLAFSGQSEDDNFGKSVSTAGDVNGDGCDDLIVGAPFYDSGGITRGRAYLYFGGADADTAADLTFIGWGSDGRFGWSVSTAGDVNGDGYADLIVGEPYSDWFDTDAGRAYVYYGGPAADDSWDFHIFGESPSDHFGTSVSTAGDVNGDGLDDFIVGAPDCWDGADPAGRAYVFLGGPEAGFTPFLTFTGAFADDLGESVSAAGDLNGDGYDDLLVGARRHSLITLPNWGRAYVYYGGPGSDEVADLVFGGESNYDRFGVSVSAAGDVDGDGHPDLICGAHEHDADGLQHAGRAYVISLYPFHLLSPSGGETWVAGESTTIRWEGYDVADISLSTDGGVTWETLAGNVGGDSENEFTLTVPWLPTSAAKVRVSYTGQNASHATSVVSDGLFRIVLPETPPSVAERLQLAPIGQIEAENFGESLSAAGDINDDGFDDFIVGAPYGYQGNAYVFHGGPDADDLPDLTLTGEVISDRFGISVASAEDIDGDGYPDLIVGAKDADRVYVYHGGPGADAVADLTLNGEVADDDFGRSVASAGDVNGDSFDDILIGAHFNDAGGTDAGRAYLYYGGPDADDVVDLILTGEADQDYFGRSVASAGDVNGDGYADMIVGAYGSDVAGDYAGAAYLFHGGPGVDDVADLVLIGEAAEDRFGMSVASAGDVDGDGYADLLVGAYNNDIGGSNAGGGYLYRGGPGMDDTADLTLIGESAGDHLGYSISSAGDVNQDGYSDIIVGAYDSDAGGSAAGRAYVYYGGPGADAIADHVLTGEAAESFLGTSVAAAGDVNGDGFDDVLAGAPGYFYGEENTGRAYLCDLNRYHLLAPVGGETWNVGATHSISWLGGEPADVWLSVDGGEHYDLLESDVGGDASNAIALLVPHQPTRFARVRVTPSDPSLTGRAYSDSLFTIDASITLLRFRVEPSSDGSEGVLLSWETDPGPEDLAGYRVEKAVGVGIGADSWQQLVALCREASYHDRQGSPGARYRLTAINGLGEELLLGEASMRPLTPLAAWPLPYRGGEMTISFATASGVGGGLGRTEVCLVDVSGRLVRWIARGDYPAGYHQAVWDGCDEAGHAVAAGLYFLRSDSGGEIEAKRVMVIR